LLCTRAFFFLLGGGPKLAKELLMGNEAIARGALEAGVKVATAYPGTPSSEILYTLSKWAKEGQLYAEWSSNEKVALEVAAGAAYSGARSLVAMKQVGLNVAADPLMSLAYMGVKGGMVIVVADDPGPHSSQNEQDTRAFGRFAQLPVLDPTTVEEAKEMTKAAFELSERLGLPVILRPTTRICHATGGVQIQEIQSSEGKPYFEKDPSWVILPAVAIGKHQRLIKLQQEMREGFANSKFNEITGSGKLGIIASGVGYAYTAEALGRLALLDKIKLCKVGTSYPLPPKLMDQFFQGLERVLVIEEGAPVLEEQVIETAWDLGAKFELLGKRTGTVPIAGEFNVDLVGKIIARFAGVEGDFGSKRKEPPQLPVRPPVLCAGCPHRGSFYAFKRAARGLDAVFSGDIGCYTLGAAKPLAAMDTCLCMGGSITIGSGLALAEPDRPHVAFIGDSTFFHTGINGLLNAVYNNANITIVILDNRTTAMTGHQPHPGLGTHADGSEGPKIDIIPLVEAAGVKFVREVDPYDFKASVEVAKEAMAYKGPAVVVMKRECVVIAKKNAPLRVDPDLCTNCQVCVKQLGCPAMYLGDGIKIAPNCNGCNLCAQVCPQNAIGRAI
jgi:indolepyruvate ferredoxin oxidoreductase alpha subunit